MLCWLILPLQLFLRNQVRENSKQRIQAAWSTPIHHVKWWISRFRGVYRVLTASEGELFFILLKGFRPLCNVTRSSALLLLLLLLLLLSLLISFLVLSRTVYCSYQVSRLFGFVSFNFFICLNLIHATTIWCWRTTSILSFGII